MVCYPKGEKVLWLLKTWWVLWNCACLSRAELLVFAGILPGQYTTVGTLWPPSQVVVLAEPPPNKQREDHISSQAITYKSAPTLWIQLTVNLSLSFITSICLPLSSERPSASCKLAFLFPWAIVTCSPDTGMCLSTNESLEGRYELSKCFTSEPD